MRARPQRAGDEERESEPPGAPRRLVLIGGGHAHLGVLRRSVDKPLAGVRLTCVFDHPHTIYSGMVPGLVAGLYRACDLTIDAARLARRAGAELRLCACTGIDLERRTIHTASGPPIPFDVASLDVGATVGGMSTPGVREHALATRPIRTLRDRLERALETARERAPRIQIVGAGAAGIEIAFALRRRAEELGMTPRLRLIERGARLLARDPNASLRKRLVRALERAGIETAFNVDIVRCTAHALYDRHGAKHPHTFCVWATGAAAHRWLLESGLPVDEHGFVRVGPTLEVEGVRGLFAAGDCAALVHAPWVPKAGVYAVRETPVLDANMRARLEGRSLPRRFRPQRDFLRLLNLSDGRAVGAKWGMSAEGRWLWWLKDGIDRRFVARFRFEA